MTALPASAGSSGKVDAVLSALPPLPSAVRYWDDYLDAHHIIRDLAKTDLWTVTCNGKDQVIRFDSLPQGCRALLKLVVVEQLSRLSPVSVLYYFEHAMNAFDRFGAGTLMELLIGLMPSESREFWVRTVVPNCRIGEAVALKAVLHSLCNQAIGPWAPSFDDYVSKFPTPKVDIYKTVRTGDCFVPLDQQSLIIDYFDELTALIGANAEQVETSVLRDACLLIVNHQHAFRPGQIARIRVPDVRIHNTGAVHLAVGLAKQRRGEAMRRVTRRVKREWCPLFIEYHARRGREEVPEGIPKDAYFLLTPDSVSDAITALVQELTGERWTPTDIRHTAAQRLADAGVSHIALSEFMGHASTRTANVYFDTSPTQAQRVNQALALSPIYANVAEVARTRTIDKAALMRLPPDKQIGGMPHGIPIAGIGGCAVGQSACVKNPVLSCYTCRKFMPVKDAAVHDDVVESLRPVVLEFAEACRGNEESPAYTQLRRTLTAAQRVAADVKAEDNTPMDSEPARDE